MSSYSINLAILNGTTDILTPVEKTCWYYGNGGTWSEQAGQHVLTMGRSGTSGMLRFKTFSGETFAIVLGIHNYKPWCGLLVDLADEETAMKVHPEYYNGGEHSGDARTGWLKRTKQGKEIGVHFVKEEGQQLAAELTYQAVR